MYVAPKNDPEFSRRRLDEIMSRDRLRFNPYTVSDSRLLELASTVGWGDRLDLTQMVILHFKRLRPTGDWRRFDVIYLTVGDNPKEWAVNKSIFSWGVTANDTVRRERSWLGKKQLKSDEDVEALAGKSVFVSRIIRGVSHLGYEKGAYRMVRLYGKLNRDAEIIRRAMCEAKIEMLERVLAHPGSPDYLSCRPGLIDYEPRIRRAIELIRQFPQTPVPEDG